MVMLASSYYTDPQFYLLIATTGSNLNLLQFPVLKFEVAILI